MVLQRSSPAAWRRAERFRFHTGSLKAKSCRDAHIIDRCKLGADDRIPLTFLLHLDEIETAVVKDHHDHRDVRPPRGFKFRYSHEKATITGQGYYRLARPHEFGSNGDGDSDTHGPQPGGRRVAQGLLAGPHTTREDFVLSSIDAKMVSGGSVERRMSNAAPGRRLVLLEVPGGAVAAGRW